MQLLDKLVITNIGQHSNFNMTVVDQINTIIESCDHKQLYKDLRFKLDSLLEFICNFVQNSAVIAPLANKEQIEIFINIYSSSAQPLLYYLTSANIDDKYIENVVGLVNFFFR